MRGPWDAARLRLPIPGVGEAGTLGLSIPLSFCQMGQESTNYGCRDWSFDPGRHALIERPAAYLFDVFWVGFESYGDIVSTEFRMKLRAINRLSGEPESLILDQRARGQQYPVGGKFRHRVLVGRMGSKRTFDAAKNLIGTSLGSEINADAADFR